MSGKVLEKKGRGVARGPSYSQSHTHSDPPPPPPAVRAHHRMPGGSEPGSPRTAPAVVGRKHASTSPPTPLDAYQSPAGPVASKHQRAAPPRVAALSVEPARAQRLERSNSSGVPNRPNGVGDTRLQPRAHKLTSAGSVASMARRREFSMSPTSPHSDERPPRSVVGWAHVAAHMRVHVTRHSSKRNTNHHPSIASAFQRRKEAAAERDQAMGLGRKNSAVERDDALVRNVSEVAPRIY